MPVLVVRTVWLSVRQDKAHLIKTSSKTPAARFVGGGGNLLRCVYLIPRLTPGGPLRSACPTFDLDYDESWPHRYEQRHWFFPGKFIGASMENYLLAA